MESTETPMRALAVALVIETDAEMGEDQLDEILGHLSRALPSELGDVVFCSTPEPITKREDGYEVQPLEWVTRR